MIVLLILCMLWGVVLPAKPAIHPHPYYHYNKISIQKGLPSSVKALCQDNRGSLWIGTPYGLYRVWADQIRSYPLPSPLRQKTSYVDRLSVDALNRVWLMHPQGLCYYQAQTDSLHVLLHRGKSVQASVIMQHYDQLVIPHRDSLWFYNAQLEPLHALPLDKKNYLIHVTPYDSNHYLVLDDVRRLWLLDLTTGHFSSSPFSSDTHVYHMFRDSHHRFWISSYGEGVKCFSQEGKVLHSFTTQNSALTNDVVLDIAEWDGAIWLATDGAGLYVVYPDEEQIRSFTTHQLPTPLSGSVTALYPVGDHLWVGTVRDGVLGVEKGFITTYQRNLLHPASGLSDKSPLCLGEDADGMIWIGTDGGGMNRFDPITETFTHYPQTMGEKIVSFCPFSATEFLVSSYTKGLFLFNRYTGTYRPWGAEFPDLHRLSQVSLAPVNVRAVSDGNVEFYGSSFYRYLRREHRLERIQTGTFPVHASWVYLGEYQSCPVFYDRQKVFAYHPATGQFDSLLPSSLGLVQAAALDKTGRLWTSTTDGVTMIELATGRQEKLALGDANPVVTSLVIDGNGVVWMGSLEGIYAYQPSNRHLSIYNEMDGVLPNDFLPKAVWATANGHVYMGGSEGLVHVNQPLKQVVPASTLRLCLQEVYLNGTFLPVVPGKRIVLPHDFESLTLRTFVEGGNTLHKRMYRFRVKGFHNGYVETSRPTYSLLTLPPGNYTLVAQCLQKDGSWSQEFVLLPFSVSPPWWLQGHFLLLVSVLLLLGMVYAAYLYDRRLQLRYAEQERTVYKEKVQTLVNIHHQLRTPLTLIYTPLKQLTNCLQIPYEQRHKLLGILRQARQMKNTMDMILNLSKMEVEKEILRMSKTDLNTWIRFILEGFKEEFAVRDIQLVLQTDERIGQLYFDLNQCEIVLNNLLGNAYKFSREHTQVTVVTELDEAVGHVRISVCDEGMGLKAEELDHLFERYYQGKHGLQGVGIGLAYAKLLVEMHGGVIGARNNPAQGATFFFTLPYRQGEAHIEVAPKAYLNGLENEWSKSGGMVDKSLLDTGGLQIAKKFHSVLLVEDDQELCHFLTCNLQALFDRVYIAHDGLEALPLLTSHRPQLVLSSICMNRMDGLELCRYIKQKPELSVIPVVLLTSWVDDEVREEAYKSGAESFVAKPFDMDLLLVQLQKILYNQSLVKQHYASLTPQGSAHDETDYPSAELLALLNRIIREHLSNPEMDVAFIARRMGMSRAGLYSKTKGLLEVGISEYITQCRLEQAAILLAQTSFTIAEVAEKVGFRHSRNFSTLFKASMGMSPSAYRKQNKTD